MLAHEIDAGGLLRQARERGGLSQSELAERAGVVQSVISAYEAGRRQPSLPTLTRLIEATGHELTLALEPRQTRGRRLSGPLGRKIREHRAQVREIASTYGAFNVRVFGSVSRGEEHAASDIDLLADLAPDTSLFTVARLQRELEAVLGAPVDIVPADDLKQGVRHNVRDDVVAL